TSVEEPPANNAAPGDLSDDEVQVSTHIAQWLQQFIAMMYALFRDCRKHEAHDIKPLEKHVTNLLIWLERDAELINALELELELANFKQHARNGRDDLVQLVMKSVMMLLYCLKTTAELKTPHDTRIRLVTASILQHVGMAQISPDILGKKGRLSPEELAEIREAPSRGKRYLQSCGIEDEYLLRAADESNERVDGSGPRGLQGKEICYSARLVGLLSMFEAMIHVRSYRKRMLPREAIRVVVQKFKPAFERTMLKALLDAISLYPIGSFVKLNSKEIGKVISCHPRLPLRPIVRITMDEYGNEIPPREIDLKNHPNLMIEQCAYEDDIKSLLIQEESK
ncbi:MAG: HD domain-containing phosphohydrolase, partial [Mariprofundus sp.]